ncbi:MAG: hypothetical protein IJN02_00285 [Bacteroidales bacterium]|nr:hypothetical protein [Bacteroidales bacterium]MBQ6687650.1 hypothetical protein [Bacteroidales bacterium]
MPRNLFKNKEDRAGLYITVIFHLTVIIILLAYQIDSTIRREESFVLDFSKQEELERREKEIEFKEDISRRLDEMIAAAHNSSKPIRNIATDASGQLRDDRGTDAEQLYKDAERLATELKDGGRDALQEDAREETVEMQHQQKKEDRQQKEYTGPSVLSYTLDGRKASHLPIPAYRCISGGDVTVIITVNNSGMVVGAKIMDQISSTDQCLRNFAIRAARLSRFSASSTAPHNQTGQIVYRFIEQ